MGSARLNLALIGFFGCVVAYALRADVSFAIVCMVNSTAVAELSGNGSTHETEKPSACAVQVGSGSAEADTVYLSIH